MKNDYKFLKVNKGKYYFAVINLKIERSEFSNEIIESFSGDGYSNHSIDVGEKGFEIWKSGLKRGLEYALSLTDKFYKITVTKIEGKITDTNPTIIAFSGILDFCNQTNISLDRNLLEQFENFVYCSWDENNFEKLPSFINLTFN